jgi:hypothetical protein
MNIRTSAMQSIFVFGEPEASVTHKDVVVMTARAHISAHPVGVSGEREDGRPRKLVRLN